MKRTEGVDRMSEHLNCCGIGHTMLDLADAITKHGPEAHGWAVLVRCSQLTEVIYGKA